MIIEELEYREGIEPNKKLEKAYNNLQELIDAMNRKELSDEVINTINDDIQALNVFLRQEEGLIEISDQQKKIKKELTKELKKVYTKTIKLLEKQLKIVPKNYYRTLWMAVGMAAFGIPLGVAFSSAVGNMGFIGLGMPIGMAIGIGVGTWLDKKAAVTGKQLQIEYSA